MLVLSKLTNINHANGGSYDPPLFLYSALFAARGRFGGASPHGGGLWWVALPAAGFGVASPHGGGFGGASPPGFLCRRGTFGLVRAVFSLFFAYAPGIRQKHPQKFRRLHLRISYCIGKFKKFVKINE